ncbi:MAG: 2-amino-4-hydroxy-6-hydroxymethyldihydropteridine diphosphokinase [Deferribacteres bacterium]|nr:2-amino-4-hydroxy-6-hydroxymethyldihydropteridine diphosphokinase [candidate division KSB1 bacterium]MCB9503322.1 2-amino-4-hydroxy-6-hydroxymethyldihydropteridine diphosphokinase [Deferribacteres bacterium]
MVEVLCSLGSNLGNRELNLTNALSSLKQFEISGVRQAKIYETEPVGLKEQPLFLNTAVLFETALAPLDLLDTILELEKQLGRVRREKWGPRIIDIDIILFGQERLENERLIIPHPRFQERKFVLAPMADLIPQVIPPGSSFTVAQLLEICEDQSGISVFTTGVS